MQSKLTYPNKGLWAIFDGAWTYERRVSSPSVVMRGIAIFQNIDDHTKQLREDGSYSLNGCEHLCFQHQTWMHDDNGSITIRKHDQRVLHVFDLHNFIMPGQTQHTHVCSPDTYHATLEVASQNQWRLIYHVNGPKKNYTSVTTFLRAIENN